MTMDNGEWLYLKIASAKNDISLRDSKNGKLFWYTFIYLISQLIYPKSKLHYYTFKVLALLSMHDTSTGVPAVFLSSHLINKTILQSLVIFLIDSINKSAYSLHQCFPTFFGSRHPYWVMWKFCGTLRRSNKYKDRWILLFGAPTSSRHPGWESLLYILIHLLRIPIGVRGLQVGNHWPRRSFCIP